MKRLRDGLMTVILVVGLMGFLGYQVLAPVNAGAAEKKAVKEEKAATNKAAAKETKTTAAPAKKAIKIRIAFPSSPSFEDIAALLAIGNLADQGYAPVPTFYAQSELMGAAIARGDADIAGGSSVTLLRVVQKGYPLKFINDWTINGYVTMASSDIKACKDLQGKNIAIGGSGSLTTALLRNWIDRTCPGTVPNYLIMPGSETRATALIAGKIDGTTVELPDYVRITAQAGDKIIPLVNFGKDLANVKAGWWAVNAQFLTKNPKAVRDFLAALLMVHRKAHADPKWYTQQALERIPGLDPKIIDDIMKAELASGDFPVNGFLTKESVDATIKFFINAKQLDGNVDSTNLLAPEVLRDVLKQIGTK